MGRGAYLFGLGGGARGLVDIALEQSIFCDRERLAEGEAPALLDPIWTPGESPAIATTHRVSRNTVQTFGYTFLALVAQVDRATAS